MIGVLGTERAALSDEAYHLLNEFLSERFGMHFPPHRRPSLEVRLQPRLRAVGVSDFLDYFMMLGVNDEELPEFIKAVTNNETYLFREREQFDALFGLGLARIHGSACGTRGLRLLSAGCSSGEEALTLAIYARERLSGGQWMGTQIDGFDLDTDRLAIANRAECRSRSLRSMTEVEISSYVEECGPDRYRVKGVYTRGVTFFQGNLVDGATFRDRAPYDAIFCRNVLIYFTQPAVRRAIDNLIDVLRPGGLLFLGHAESIIGMFDSLSTVRLGQTIAYQRA